MASRGYFGIGFYHPKKIDNLGTLYRTAYSAGASFLFTIGPRYRRQASDTVNAAAHCPLFTFPSWDEFRAYTPYDCPIIGVEQGLGATALDIFVHPPRAVYVLGAEDHGLPHDVLTECHRVVEIRGFAQCLNVSVAGALVLYDRLRKNLTA